MRFDDLPISEREFSSRVSNTLALMEKRNIDSIVLFASYPEREGHVEYLTNYRSSFPPSQSNEIYKGLGYSAVVLSASTGPVLFPGSIKTTTRTVGIRKTVVSENLPLSISEYVQSSLSNTAKATVGIVGGDVIPWLYFYELKKNLQRSKRRTTIRLVQSDEILISQRMIKSPAEQEIMKQAAKVADAGLEAAIEKTSPGVAEYEIALAATKACYEQGADFVTRTRIYGKGIPLVRWPILGRRRFEEKDLAGLDLVGWYKGYGFDVLRRWPVGQPTVIQKELLEKAAFLTEETIRRTRSGMSGDEVSTLALQISQELKLDRRRVNPHGHAIGLEIVENPILLPKSKKPALRPGVVACIEPGIEQRDYGAIHFEDEVILNEQGEATAITHCPKITW